MGESEEEGSSVTQTVKTINLMSMQDPKAVKQSVAEQFVSIIFHGEIDSQAAGTVD